MTVITPAGATIPGVTHHLADVNGARLHYVSAGTSGSPILLVHGWPESWWAFRNLIPLLAQTHRVFAVDLPGIPTMLLPGHERDLLANWAYPMMTAVKGSVTEDDLDEITRTYARPNGWRGTEGLYHS